jgi:hypothetical protein
LRVGKGTEFMTGPREGVDHRQLAAEMPQVRAQLDYIDQTLFEVSPAVFATLIDLRPDSGNHASHLVITKVEKSKLRSDIDVQFGGQLNWKHANYTIASARIVRDSKTGSCPSKAICSERAGVRTGG